MTGWGCRHQPISEEQSGEAESCVCVCVCLLIFLLQPTIKRNVNAIQDSHLHTYFCKNAGMHVVLPKVSPHADCLTVFLIHPHSATRCYQFLCFSHEETLAQGVQRFTQDLTAKKCWNWDLNPVSSGCRVPVHYHPALL